ncbi:hypothetical protein JR316_0011243 [Psilocybe cubensis]|uniref:Uncharacterized protein n=2 Tax=Psilocybe cubensis TaxID=181762 RepID=A0A8H7XTX8_PSICU|nr:hypothetical protein JR316_0011243 [Psilocybe cubensis]KAH9475684.1 hypothetical protein JR316_0011243 [Psilocybe cubensis]
MPKHIPSEHYTSNPYEIVPNAHVHPDVEHHDHPEDTERYLLPAVFSSEKGFTILGKYPGPGVYYIVEGEGQYEDTMKSGSSTIVKAGSVIHVEEGSILRWHGKPGVKGFAVFHVPVAVKSLDEFVVPE